MVIWQPRLKLQINAFVIDTVIIKTQLTSYKKFLRSKIQTIEIYMSQDYYSSLLFIKNVV